MSLLTCQHPHNYQITQTLLHHTPTSFTYFILYIYIYIYIYPIVRQSSQENKRTKGRNELFDNKIQTKKIIRFKKTNNKQSIQKINLTDFLLKMKFAFFALCSYYAIIINLKKKKNTENLYHTRNNQHGIFLLKESC
jgi:hypothetical protein